MNSVHDIVVKHQILEIHETCNLFFLLDKVDDLLVLGEHVILNDLFTKAVHNLVVVDTVCRAVHGGVLTEAKPSLKG
jgi:hypothetical protein